MQVLKPIVQLQNNSEKMNESLNSSLCFTLHQVTKQSLTEHNIDSE